MSNHTTLPERLHPACRWVEAAGEILVLGTIKSEAEADAYANEAADNAEAHDQTDVSAADILALWRWLRSTR